MIGVGRSAVTTYASRLDRRGMVELLGGDIVVAGVAEVASVLVNVLAALGQRYGVVDNGSEADDAAIKAALA